MGEVCTRACTFCNIATGKPPEDLDIFEPGRVADAVKKLGLNHVVVTSVDRDDVQDGGAEHFAQTIRAIRKKSPNTTIEILTPDFIRCDDNVLKVVVDAKPDVFNHNLETVPGLYPEVRPGARYFHSLRLLQRVKEIDPTMFTKSGIMVGLGENKLCIYLIVFVNSCIRVFGMRVLYNSYVHISVYSCIIIFVLLCTYMFLYL